MKCGKEVWYVIEAAGVGVGVGEWWALQTTMLTLISK